MHDYFVFVAAVAPYLPVLVSELGPWSVLLDPATHEVLTATLALRGPLDLLAPRMQCITTFSWARNAACPTHL